MTNDFEEAEQDFREMQSLDPTTEADAKAGLAKVRRREQVRNSLLSEKVRFLVGAVFLKNQNVSHFSLVLKAQSFQTFCLWA